jgi:murein peptide amidase A
MSLASDNNLPETFPWISGFPTLSPGWIATELHRSAHGPIMALHKAAPGKPVVYISSGIHGDEPAGPLALAHLWQENFFDDSIEWLICPALNPGGLRYQTRETPEGHDLNRDYLTLATKEVAAHRAWLESMPKPDLFLSLHEDWETSGIYFYEINLHHDHPERAQRLLESAQPWFQPEPGPIIDGHKCRAPGWIYHPAHPDLPQHWPEAIYLSHRGCPLSFTLETPSAAPLADRVACQAALLQHIFQNKSEFGL